MEMEMEMEMEEVGGDSETMAVKPAIMVKRLIRHMH